MVVVGVVVCRGTGKLWKGVMAVEEKGGGERGGGREGEERRKSNTEAMWMQRQRGCGGRRQCDSASERFCLPTKAKKAYHTIPSKGLM